MLLGPHETISLELAGGGGTEMLTLVAVQDAPCVGREGGEGVCFATIGLTNMLNAGGVVLRWGAY